MATRQATPLTGELLCLGPEPCNITCPSCRTTALTIVARERTTCWHYTAPCCWLLFSCCGKCLNSWADPRDSNHYCSKCGCFLGRYHERKSISE